MKASVRPGLSRRDLWILGLMALPLAAIVLPPIFGRTYFWGDLLYLHHPWRALPAEMLQRGVLPLWNPHIYMGIPMAASMQGSTWYPGTVPFYFFGFETALAFFHALHFWLAGALAFLWLRSIGMSRFAAAAGGIAWVLSGQLIRDLPFLNHLSTLAYLPGFLLFGTRPLFLGLALALSFLSGYPIMLAGSAIAAFLITAAQGRLTPLVRRWALASVFALGLGSVMLIPALELTTHSRRSGGIQAQETLTWSMTPGDLIQFTSPLLIPKDEFSPAYKWWKAVYWGLFGIAAAALGFSSLTPVGMGAVAAYLLGAVLLMLGGSNPLSQWLWTHLPLLNYVRYPGNTSFVAAPVLMYLIARGLNGRRWALWGAILIVGELFLYSWIAHPTVPRGYFTEAGPLVRNLQKELKGHRYLLSPLALNHSQGRGDTFASASMDLKHRLYGLTNAPFHLSGVGNFGEPLVPQNNYAVMDHLYSRQGLSDLEPWLRWVDARILLTRDRLPPGGLIYQGDSLWHLYAPKGKVERAYWLSDKEAALLPEKLGAKAPPPMGIPLSVESLREDRVRVQGNSEHDGWVFLAEPLDADWKTIVRSKGIETEPESVPALTAFKRFRVPAGEWTLESEYAPMSLRMGLLLTLLSLLGVVGFAFKKRIH